MTEDRPKSFEVDYIAKLASVRTHQGKFPVEHDLIVFEWIVDGQHTGNRKVGFWERKLKEDGSVFREGLVKGVPKGVGEKLISEGFSALGALRPEERAAIDDGMPF